MAEHISLEHHKGKKGNASGATSGFLSGIGNTLANRGNISDAFSNGLRQAAIQGSVGALFGGVVGGISASACGRNFWDGGPKLEEKLSIIYENNKQAITEQLGDVDAEADVYVGSSKNFKKLGYENYRNRRGDIYDKSKHIRANGLTKRVLSTMEKVGGYEEFQSRIFISKSRIRMMWRGNQNAYETLFHEFWHVRDIANGMHSYISYHYGEQSRAMLEFRAYQFSYSRTCGDYYLNRMEYWADILLK